MERIDLINRILPNALSVTVVRQDGEIYLVDANRRPKQSDKVLLADGKVYSYDPASMNGSARGVVYAAIRFMVLAVFCLS